MDEEQLYQFCALNTELRIERNADGEIIVMFPENISSGWLLHPRTRTVYIYRPGKSVEERHDPAQVSGEVVLPGFVLDVPEVWKAMEF